MTGMQLCLATVPLLSAHRKLDFVLVDASRSESVGIAVGRVLMEQLLVRMHIGVPLEVWRLASFDVDVGALAGSLQSTRELRFAETDENTAKLCAASEPESARDLLACLRLAREGQGFNEKFIVPTFVDLDSIFNFAGVDQLETGVLVTDATLDAPGPYIEYVNAQMCRITGYRSEELIGRNPRIFQGPNSDRSELARCRRTLERGEMFQGETVNYRKDGSEFFLRWGIQPLTDQTGRVTRFLSYQRDVTELRRYESIARATNTATSLTTMVSSIRHEIGNPVNSVKAAVSYLRKRHATQSIERIEEYYDAILSELARIENLLGTFRSFTAYEAPKLADVDLGRFMGTFGTLVEPLMQQRNCHLVAEIPTGTTLRVDPRAFQQILLNLITNAADALTESDDREIRVSALMTNVTTLVTVADRGSGISSERMTTLFTPFATTKPGGTGLGLVICKRLSEQMGGTIRCESKANVGTRMILSFPTKRKRSGTWTAVG